MVTVTVKRNEAGNIVAFSASGHSGYGPQGEDIVCAAVSAILQTAVFGLHNYLEFDPQVETEDGWLSCQIKPKTARDSEAKAVLETMFVGLKETEKTYSDYLKVIEGRTDND